VSRVSRVRFRISLRVSRVRVKVRVRVIGLELGIYTGYSGTKVQCRMLYVGPKMPSVNAELTVCAYIASCVVHSHLIANCDPSCPVVAGDLIVNIMICCHRKRRPPPAVPLTRIMNPKIVYIESQTRLILTQSTASCLSWT